MNHIHKNETGDLAVAWESVSSDRATLVHARDAYGFLLARGEQITLGQFAARIREHCAHSPRINAICSELERAQ